MHYEEKFDGGNLNHICPLCNGHECLDYFQDQRRQYFQCSQCCLVFVDPSQRLSALEEKSEYDLHENSIDNRDYRQFLSRLFDPLVLKIKPQSKGLDFGCGPGPALSSMFEESGFLMKKYDVFYDYRPNVLLENYDFITATEVVEHLFSPGEVIEGLWQQLSSGGILGLMTKLLSDPKAFSHWHYKNDQTHVCFFSQESFRWLSRRLNARLEIVGNDVILLYKK